MPEPRHPLLPRAPHGGAESEPFAGLDFSANVNPFGPNMRLVGRARFADVSVYPDPAMRAAREALAGLHAADPREVAPASGASELLHRLARAYLAPGDLVLSVLAPFGEFARAAALERAELRQIEPEAAADTVASSGAKLVYLSRPHNPLGVSLPAADVLALAEVCAGVGALLILDEVYADLDPKLEAVPAHPALVRLRSPGKAHGLVGLRPAYAVGPAGVIAALDNLAPSWPVSVPTLAVLEHLPGETGFVKDTVPAWRAKAASLAAGFGSLAAEGVVVHDAGLPFFTLEVPRAEWVAAELRARGVRVRHCASYGLPDRLRVSARRSEENRELVLKVRAVVRGG